MAEFQVSDVTNQIDQETRNLISDLVLAWARYDSLLTQWTFRAFGMGPDEGAIILGNMDSRTKLERLKALYTHFGMTTAANQVKDLAKLHKTHVEVRNAICHKACAGHSRSDPDRIIFTNPKTFPQKPGQMLVELVHIDQMKDAIRFATSASDQIFKVVEPLVAMLEARREQSPEQPEASPPNPEP